MVLIDALGREVFRAISTKIVVSTPHHRGFVDFAAIKHLRDQGLNHAVWRGKHLKPMLNIKNLIKSEPAKSLPLSVITHQKDSLEIPTRPIEFTYQA
ncbi:hypothetical protein MANES_08G075937v8 [Manihot esculenta]|uniref:Uncharacterized protein n=1 Tax=Manihot esculenta TaxID=3983 RepID=A0ACB7H9P5_MANES|nr:hypothetical protein MANES_08G075937v8 [Manihot esculenta]